MAASVLFLISCIFTARFLEKRKMHVASVMYSAVFAGILIVLLLAVDIPIIQTAFSNMMGAREYAQAHEFVRDVVSTDEYGISTITVMVVVFVVQIITTLIQAAKAVVTLLIRKTTPAKFKKRKLSLASPVRTLYLPRQINLLYCRMLN